MASPKTKSRLVVTMFVTIAILCIAVMTLGLNNLMLASDNDILRRDLDDVMKIGKQQNEALDNASGALQRSTEAMDNLINADVKLKQACGIN